MDLNGSEKKSLENPGGPRLLNSSEAQAQNEQSCSLLELSTAQLDLGSAFEGAKRQFSRLNSNIENLAGLIRDPDDAYLRKFFNNVKVNMSFKTNDLRERIDLLAKELLKSLDEFESECAYRARQVCVNYLEDLRFFQQELERHALSLSVPKVNESKWRSIESQLIVLNQSIVEKTKALKSSLVSNKHVKLKLNLQELDRLKFNQEPSEQAELDQSVNYMHRQYCYMPCGHSFCDKCLLGKLIGADKSCPTCNLEFDHLFANYGLVDLINEFTHSIKNVKASKDFNLNSRMPIITYILRNGLPGEQLSLARWIRTQIYTNVSGIHESDSEIDSTVVDLFEEFISRCSSETVEQKATSQEIVYEMVLILVKMCDEQLMQKQRVANSKIPSQLSELMLSFKISDKLKEAILLFFYKITKRIDDSDGKLQSILIEGKFLRQIVNILAGANHHSLNARRIALVFLVNLTSMCMTDKQKSTTDYVIPMLNTLLTSQDAFVLVNTCRILTNLVLSERDSIVVYDQLTLVIDNTDLENVMRLLRTDQDVAVLHAALRLIGCFASGDNEHAAFILTHKFDLLPNFFRLLDLRSDLVVKEICWIISILTSGHHRAIQAVISNNLYVKLIEILYSIRLSEDQSEDEIYQTRHFILDAIEHLISHGTQKELDYLINLNVIQALVSCLDSSNKRLVEYALDCIYKILYIGLGLPTLTNPYRRILEETGGFKKISMLQYKDFEPIITKSSKIVDAFF